MSKIEPIEGRTRVRPAIEEEGFFRAFGDVEVFSAFARAALGIDFVAKQISRKLGPSLVHPPDESPEQELLRGVPDLIEALRGRLDEARKVAAAASEDEVRLRGQLEREVASVAEWEQRALQAVYQNNDELARDALRRKRDHVEQGRRIAERLAQQRAAVEQLHESIQALERRIEAAERNRQSLLGSLRIAHSKAAFDQLVLGSDRAVAFLDRLEAAVGQRHGGEPLGADEVAALVASLREADEHRAAALLGSDERCVVLVEPLREPGSHAVSRAIRRFLDILALDAPRGRSLFVVAIVAPEPGASDRMAAVLSVAQGTSPHGPADEARRLVLLSPSSSLAGLPPALREWMELFDESRRGSVDKARYADQGVRKAIDRLRIGEPAREAPQEAKEVGAKEAFSRLVVEACRESGVVLTDEQKAQLGSLGAESFRRLMALWARQSL